MHSIDIGGSQLQDRRHSMRVPFQAARTAHLLRRRISSFSPIGCEEPGSSSEEGNAPVPPPKVEIRGGYFVFAKRTTRQSGRERAILTLPVQKLTASFFCSSSAGMERSSTSVSSAKAAAGTHPTPMASAAAPAPRDATNSRRAVGSASS